MLKQILWRWEKIKRRWGKRQLRSHDFSIISNNCWGGFVYQYFDLPYGSPFVGLFLFAPDYIKMLQDLKGYLFAELTFIDPQQSRYRQQACGSEEFGRYPIGMLRDIEIHFLHYHSPEEAKKKWDRRVARINFNNLLIKFSDRDGCTEELIAAFDQLGFSRKVCLTVKPYSYRSCFQMEKSQEDIPKDEWKVFLAHTRPHTFINRFYPRS